LAAGETEETGATVQSKDGLHSYAKWGQGGVGAVAPTSGFGVVEFDADTLQEANQQFFYIDQEANFELAEKQGFQHISDMAEFLSDIPIGRAVAIASVFVHDNNNWFDEPAITAALQSMGVRGPSVDEDWHGAFSAFGFTGCGESSTCPSWVTDDYQVVPGQSSSSDAKICVAKGTTVDEFGCYTRAGYSFCATLNACVQNWEGGHMGPCPAFGGGVSGDETNCQQFEAIGEGCNHHSRECGACGCATIRSVDLVQSDPEASDVEVGVDVVNHDHADGKRGWGIGVLHPLTFAKEDDKFFGYTDLTSLTTFLEGIEAGKIVAVMTNDEPFGAYRGDIQVSMNAALSSMGIPPPPHDPEYRGAFAGMGQAGCTGLASCPSWAGSTYTGRYENSAILERQICASDCVAVEAGVRYTHVPYHTVNSVADVEACAILCDEDYNCFSYTYGKTEAEVLSYQKCNLLVSLPSETTKEVDVNYDSGVPECYSEKQCITFRAVGEGCNHSDKKCNSCGCATLTTTAFIGQSVQSLESIASHGVGYRGWNIVTLDPMSLAMIEQKFIAYHLMYSTSSSTSYLNNYLEQIPEGNIVIIATVDEPFGVYVNHQQVLDALLVSMGMPPPPTPPEYRAGFAGFGVAGCHATSTCPEWASSDYKPRYNSAPAKKVVEICPAAKKGLCEPKGTYQPNECCPAGFASVTDSRVCESLASGLLPTYAFDGATTVPFDTSAQHPTGCFYNEAASTVQFNRHNVAGKGLLAGGDKVLCRKQIMAAPKYEESGWTFHSPNTECSFRTVGANFYHDHGNYPACSTGFHEFITVPETDESGKLVANDGFCCSGNCASSVDAAYVRSPGDSICHNGVPAQLFGEEVDACSAQPPANKFCEWALGPLGGPESLSAWKDYVVRGQMSFKGQSAGITVRVQDPSDEMSPRYWFKFQKSMEDTISIGMSYFDGSAESVVQPDQLNMIAPIVRFQTAPLPELVEADLEKIAATVDEAIVNYDAEQEGAAMPAPDRWTRMVHVQGGAIVTDLLEEEFNTKFAACPVVRYVFNGAINGIYKRTRTGLYTIADINAYKLFTDTWVNQKNNIHEDFELYSNEEDTRTGMNKWQFCNYNDPDVGFPRDCGKTGPVGGRWFTMPGGRLTRNEDIAFDIYTGENCPNAVAASCADAACNGAASTLLGIGEYCTDGWSCCNTNAPVSNDGCTTTPCWSKGNSCPPPQLPIRRAG